MVADLVFDKILVFTDIVVTVVMVVTLYFIIKEFQQSRIVRKQEIYTKLEMASVDLFKLTINYPELNQIYSKKPKKKYERLTVDEKWRITDYTTSILNLFEIQFKLWLSDDIDTDVFKTWIPWTFMLCNGSYFHLLWGDNKMHYLPELQKFFDELLLVVKKVKDPVSCEKEFNKKAFSLIEELKK